MTDRFDDDVRLEWYRSNTAVTKEIGVMALRTLITLNSGAFVVLLTFIGNVASQAQFTVPLEIIKFSLGSFLMGISAAFVAIAYTYLVSVEADPYQGKPVGWSKFYVPAVVSVSGISFLAFVVGVASIVQGVEAL